MSALLAALAFLVIPLPSLAGSYDALCNATQKCVVKILNDRLIVGDSIVPIDAIASWSKSGPGRTATNSTTGSILTILLHNYNHSSNSPYYLKGYQSSFNLSYYTADQKEDQVSIGFVNESVSRWFEIELQAATGLPKQAINDKAPLFKWTPSDYPAPQNTPGNPYP